MPTREILAPLFDWWGHTAMALTIRGSSALIALTETIHLLGLTMLIGTIMMVDLAMLGFGIRRHPVARIAGELAPWTTCGLLVMLISGPLILSSEALKCYDASFFWIKMAGLFAAVVFHFTIHRRVALSEPPAGRFRAGLVACVSLALWTGVALAGKMIGIYGDDLRQENEPFQVRSTTGKSGLQAVRREPRFAGSERPATLHGVAIHLDIDNTVRRQDAPGGRIQQ